MAARKPSGRKPKLLLKPRLRNWRAYRKESASTRRALAKLLRRINSAERVLRRMEKLAGKYEKRIRAIKPLLPWSPGDEYLKFAHKPREPLPEITRKIEELKQQKAPLEQELAAIRKKHGYKT